MEEKQKDPTVIAPGLYRSVDPAQMEQLKHSYDNMMEDTKSKGRKWCEHKAEYEKLKEKLISLPEKTSHKTTIPMTKKAFMLGELVHTNEITVLLGDNWFALRSAKQATEICDRRLKQCDEMLKDLDKELKLVESWCREADQMDSDSKDGNLEIREPYDEATEKAWRQKHRESVLRQKNQKEEKDPSAEDKKDEDDLWKRLDELELEEELDEYEKTLKDLEEGEESDISSEDYLSDELEDIDEENEDEENEEPETEEVEDEKRKVSFGPSESSYGEENSSSTKIKIGESVNFIEIIHSQDFEEPSSSTTTSNDFLLPPEEDSKCDIESPADLGRKFGNLNSENGESGNKTRSILKSFDPQSIRIDANAALNQDTPDRRADLFRQPHKPLVRETSASVRKPLVLENPVSEIVVEKNLEDSTSFKSNMEQSGGKKVSKFKQNRMKNGH